MVELVYKFDKKSYCECLKKVSRSLKYSNIFFVHKHMDTSPDHFTPLALRVRGNKDIMVIQNLLFPLEITSFSISSIKAI